MRVIFNILTIFTLCAALSGCDKENISDGKGVLVSLHIDRTVGVETRLTSGQEEGTMTWEDGDIIWVDYLDANSEEAKAKFVYNAGEETWISDPALYVTDVTSVTKLVSYGGKETDPYDVEAQIYDQSTEDKYFSYDMMESAETPVYDSTTGGVTTKLRHTRTELVINISYDMAINHLSHPSIDISFYLGGQTQDGQNAKAISMFATNVNAEATSPYDGKTVMRAILKPEFLNYYTSGTYAGQFPTTAKLCENGIEFANLSFTIPAIAESLSGKRIVVNAKYTADARLMVYDVSIDYEVRLPEIEVIPPDGILIGSAEDFLKHFGPDARLLPSGVPAYYKLTADIDLGGVQWTPSNKLYTNDNSIVFDGNGHAVSNFRIEGAVREAGLFNLIGQGVTVQNLTLKDVVIDAMSEEPDPEDTDPDTTPYNAGALAAQSYGAVINCKVVNSTVNALNKALNPKNLLMSSCSYAGNLVGENYGAIRSCTVEGGNVAAMQSLDNNQSAISAAGGIVGYNCAEVTGCRSTDTTVYSLCAGGISGVDLGVSSLTGNISSGCTITGLVNFNNTGYYLQGGISGASFLGNYSENYWNAANVAHGVGLYVKNEAMTEFVLGHDGAMHDPNL